MIKSIVGRFGLAIANKFLTRKPKDLKHGNFTACLGSKKYIEAKIFININQSFNFREAFLNYINQRGQRKEFIKL